MTYYLVEVIKYTGRRKWVLTTKSKTQAEEEFARFCAAPTSVNVALIRWVGEQELPHGSYAIRHCAGGAKSEVTIAQKRSAKMVYNGFSQWLQVGDWELISASEWAEISS